MTIHLKPELEALIQKDLESGAYQSMDEFVERAVQRLHEEEAWLNKEREVIREKIARARSQFEKGEGLTPEEAQKQFEIKKKAWLSGRES